MDHRTVAGPLAGTARVYSPEDPAFTPEVKGKIVLVLAVHNREVSGSSLVAKLHALGFPRIITLVELYDSCSKDLGDRYWLTGRQFYRRFTAEIGQTYEFWADETSRRTYVDTLGFRLSGDYLHYSIDENKFRDSFRPFFGNAVNQMSIDGGGLGIITLAVNGKMPVLPLPVITPYLTGGVGLAWVSRDQVTTSITGFTGATIPSSSQSGRTLVDVGAGVDIKIGIALFVEAKYAWIFTDGSNSTYVPVTIGVTF